MPASIPSPYNFVPVGKYVYFPEWSDEVTHDIPFEDGVSGWVDVEVEAETPLLIGGETGRGKSGPAKKSFVTLDGVPAIPGSTLKGMLRSVVEIASYGKLQRFNDHRFSIRDLYDERNYRNHMTETVGPQTYRSRVLAGWLSRATRDGEVKWHLTPCDYGRVDRSELLKFAAAEKVKMEERDLRERNPAGHKYSVWKNGGLSLTVHARVDAEQPYKHSPGRLVYRRVTDVSRLAGTALTPGRIVFTGQPGSNKHMEFFFFERKDAAAIEVDNRDFKDFQFIHREGQERHEREYRGNDEYCLMESFIEDEGRAPVFYLPPDASGRLRMGLAMMFKLPCARSVEEVLRRQAPWHLERSRPDLADLIFGHVVGRAALRGRLSIEAARLQGAPQYGDEPKVTGGGRRQYDGYMSDRARLRGWKRYPVRNATQSSHIPERANDSVMTILKPLVKGSRFIARFHFHNLKTRELGAVLWAIDFGGEKRCRHSVGTGKPLGYGQVRLGVIESSAHLEPNSSKTAVNLEFCRQAFVAHMEAMQPGWAQGEALTHLREMADPALGQKRLQELRYPVLDGKTNDFTAAKKDGLVLEPYADFRGQSDEVRLQKAYNEAAARLGLLEPGNPAAGEEARKRSHQPTAATSLPAVDEPLATEVWSKAFLIYNAGGGGALIVSVDGSHEKVVTPVAQASWFRSLPDELQLRARKKTVNVTAEVTVRIGAGARKVVSVKAR
ncbi:MAG: TIGR03986 family CRISPR-associated RAMP protein [Candidatus Wallbacteria bacterium]|nr:TIGR03986 family CRISPR-associated RAMP protein [Candidatus Wallbacteria bacterium]